MTFFHISFLFDLGFFYYNPLSFFLFITFDFQNQLSSISSSPKTHMHNNTNSFVNQFWILTIFSYNLTHI
eukprot:UN02187